MSAWSCSEPLRMELRVSLGKGMGFLGAFAAPQAAHCPCWPQQEEQAALFYPTDRIQCRQEVGGEVLAQQRLGSMEPLCLSALHKALPAVDGERMWGCFGSREVWVSCERGGVSAKLPCGRKIGEDCCELPGKVDSPSLQTVMMCSWRYLGMWSSGGLVSVGLTVRLNDFRGLSN